MPGFEYHFEWDAKKASANIRKHGVRFERAASVFHDPDALSLFDREHSGAEERWITLGLDNQGQLLVVCHTWRETHGGAASCRIISAWKATRNEIRQYRSRKT